MRFPSKLPTKYVIPLLLISVIGTAAAVVTLFTHTFPAILLVSGPPAIITTCSALVAEGPPPTLGVAGNATFDCGFTITGGVISHLHPAFNFTGSGSSWIPVFTLPTNITGLSFSVARNSLGYPDCHASNSFITLLRSSFQSPLPPTPAGQTSIANTQAVYCASYSSGATFLPSFTVTWTQ